MSENTQQIPDIKLREMQEKDKPFIFNSWLKSFKDAPINAKVPDKFYYSYNHAVIDRILASDKTKVVIASAPRR